MRLLAVAILLAVGVGCANKVDSLVTKRVLARGAAIPDVGETCALGVSLRHGLAAAGSKKHPPHRALVIAEVAAALCAEPDAWEAELRTARTRKNLTALGPDRVNELRDAREAEKRAHAIVAARFYRAFQQAEAQWGTIGEGCPSIKPRDELVYILGLFAGLNGVLHDRASGARVDIPLDTVAKVARGSECIPNEAWWHVPGVFQAGAWAVVPGSGPPEADAWAMLESEAKAGEASGVRLARAVAVLVAANADHTEAVRQGIVSHAQALKSTKANPQWQLFDRYARNVTRHQSDLLWARATGHRTLDFGALPGDAKPSEPAGPDTFGDDPFGDADGDDPFGSAEPTPSQPPIEEAP